MVKVDILSDSSQNGNLPAAPEFGNNPRKIGIVDVAHQVEAEQAKNGLEAVGKEVEVLEYSEYSKVDDNVGCTDATLTAGIPVESFHQKSAAVTAQ